MFVDAAIDGKRCNGTMPRLRAIFKHEDSARGADMAVELQRIAHANRDIS